MRDAEVADNGFDKFRMEGFSWMMMIGDCDSDALWITENLMMAARLPGLYKAKTLNDSDGLSCGKSRQAFAHTVSSRVVTLMDSEAGMG